MGVLVGWLGWVGFRASSSTFHVSSSWIFFQHHSNLRLIFFVCFTDFFPASLKFEVDFFCLFHGFFEQHSNLRLIFFVCFTDFLNSTQI